MRRSLLRNNSSLRQNEFDQNVSVNTVVNEESFRRVFKRGDFYKFNYARPSVTLAHLGVILSARVKLVKVGVNLGLR